MTEKIWFYAINGEQKGPIDGAELDLLTAVLDHRAGYARVARWHDRLATRL